MGARGGTRADVTAEMTHYLKTYQLDGLITDNPDKAPK
jgi:hypothetical protein